MELELIQGQDHEDVKRVRMTKGVLSKIDEYAQALLDRQAIKARHKKELADVEKTITDTEKLVKDIAKGTPKGVAVGVNYEVSYKPGDAKSISPKDLFELCKSLKMQEEFFDSVAVGLAKAEKNVGKSILLRAEIINVETDKFKTPVVGVRE